MDALNEQQRKAADAVLAGESLFITGPGGTGKSFLLQTLHDHFETLSKTLAITAMTGCAALLIGSYAKTLHSWAGIGLGRGSVDAIVEAIVKDGKKKKRWRADCLVIDEVSMMTPALLELLDAVGQRVRKNKAPFGGLQMVFVGDFYQLPPVAKDGPAAFAFTSPLWPAKTVELTQILRQKDPVFQQILNEARRGELSAESYAALEARKTMDWKRQEIKPTLLFTKNNDVNAINENQLAKLVGEEKIFTATTSAHPKMSAQAVQWAVEKLDKDASYEPVLKLKVRAQVMLLKQLMRDDTDDKGRAVKCPIQGLVNGSRGIVTEFAYDGYPMVKFLNGPPYPVKVGPAPWDSDAEKPEEKVTREQIPLRLAYALTIHKAQGASLDSALIDVGPSTFECGQAYVALSRVRSLEALFIYEISPRAFKAHPAVKAFYAGVEEYVPTSQPVIESAEEGSVSESSNNVGKAWTKDEEAKLLKGIAEQETLQQLSENHGRTVGGIRSRLALIAATQFTEGKAIDEIQILTGVSERRITDAVAKYKSRINPEPKDRTVHKSITETISGKPVPPCECGKAWTAQSFTESNQRNHMSSKKHIDIMSGKRGQKTIVDFLPSTADEAPPGTP